MTYRIVTPFRPFKPESFEHKDLGRFDWVGAIGMLRASAARQGVEVVTITDVDTEVPGPMFRYQTRHRRLMPWIVEIAQRYIDSEDFDQDTVMVSPDILVFGDLGRWFDAGEFDLGLLARPKGTRLWRMNPMLNSVQFWPRRGRTGLRRLYEAVGGRLDTLSEEQLVWGGDTTPFIELFGPVEPGHVHVGQGTVLFLNADDVMLTFTEPLMRKGAPDRLVDFRYKRKLLMRDYFERKFAPMLEVNGWFFASGDRFMAAEINGNGEYQKPHLDAAIAHTKGRRVAVDGGAHVGTWSIPLSKVFRTVLAFEPSGDTFAALQANLTRQGVENVKPREMALGARAGRADVSLEGDERAKQTGNLGARRLAPGVSIPVVPLDSFELKDLDLLKLDVEGSEVDALKGARETLLRCKPTVLFEDKNLWRRYGYARRAPHEFLAELGAKPLQRIAMDEIWGWPS